MTNPSLVHWLVASLPIVLLLGLVISGRLSSRLAALMVFGLAAILAATVFAAGGTVLAVAVGKGLWLAGWILAVVWPAMLLYRIAESGGFHRIGPLFASLFPNRSENLLVLAWILPSFVQGVAGFGAPIALAAPLLLASGWSRVRSVAYPLIGYHWSVTFGSMGSSFYVAALTAQLDAEGQQSFAWHAAVLLGVNCLVAGALVLLIDGGTAALRRGLRLLALGGIAMATTLVGVAQVVPAVASVAAGGAGAAIAVLLAAYDGRKRRTPRSTPVQWSETGQAIARTVEPDTPESLGVAGRDAGWIMAPYLYLLGAALLVLLVPASRDWVETHVVLAPSFPATTTGLDWHNPAVTEYTRLEVFAHPGTFILVACVLGQLTYRARGLWQPVGVRELARRWMRSVFSVSVSIVGLACTATILVEAGMISALARGVALAGPAYPAVAGLVGALGSFLTGSSTSSNALFAPLQAEIAALSSVPEPAILAAQTAGANIGNSLALVLVVLGLGAVGGGDDTSAVLRLVLLAAGPLLAVVGVVTSIATL